MTSDNKSALLRMENGDGGTYAPGNPKMSLCSLNDVANLTYLAYFDSFAYL